MLTAVSAPTRLAVEMAEQHNLALAGLVRGNTFTAYSHSSRFMTSQPIAAQA
jgi:FdhD protein